MLKCNYFLTQSNEQSKVKDVELIDSQWSFRALLMFDLIKVTILNYIGLYFCVCNGQ